jgi:hypothetical protein
VRKIVSSSQVPVGVSFCRAPGASFFQTHFRKRVVSGNDSFFCALHYEPSPSARAHRRDGHAAALTTHHVPVSIDAFGLDATSELSPL